MPMHSGLLPREGLTGDPVFRLIGQTALNPTFLLPLVLLARWTKRGEKWRILHPKAFSRLKTLLYLALVRIASSWYSNKALNNWVSDPKWDWPRETAVITGGAGGIGAHVVSLLAERGVRVAVLDVQDMAYEPGANVAHFKCDITSSQQIAEVAAAIREKWGDPTILVNNAGVARGKTILEGTEKDTRFTFDVNTISHYLLAREFVPAMAKRDHGMIVTVASYAAFITVPNMVDYAASKAAASSFHEGLAAELRTRYNAPRVRTVLVNQGYTKTKLFTGYHNDSPFLIPSLEPETIADEIAKQIFSGKSGQVIVPRFGVMLTALRAFPHWYQTNLRARGQNIMMKWTGRQVIKDLDRFYDSKEKPAVEESGVLVPDKSNEGST
ncbi:hypothetical protein MKZ38_008608 [Zalerion maritima]|uniref:Short-chain dehydrogenase/reductase 3 n=1 Tax=Zalerion maritima TaxID=339359 RepID=A0AAD5WXG9_9PEZI|nr:hypothetical protein MKZ38_008608 [Zalerion maritima]